MIRRATAPILRTSVRCSPFSSSKVDKDFVDMLRAQSVFGVTENMLKVLTSSHERNHLNRLKDNFLDRVPLKPLFAFNLYCELNNPLVKKYKFDPDEFLVGARESGSQFFEALVDPELFEYFKEGENGPKPSSVEFVESVTSPVFFKICRDTVSILSQHNVKPNLQSVDIGKACILKMTSECREPDFESDRSFIIQKNSLIISATLANVLGHPKRVPVPARNYAKELFVADDLTDIVYHGVHSVDFSVLLTVEVYYEIKLNYGKDQGSTSQEAPVSDSVEEVGSGSTVEAKNDVSSIARLTFHGCISGQTELDWKVVSIGFL